MRPLVKNIFEREGRLIVGSRWTSDQVRQAYEKANDLMDYISDYKAFKPVQELGIDRIHPDFESGFEARVAKNLPDEAVQSLSLSILGDLLGKGRNILRSAAWVYKYAPDTFKTCHASSKQAFLKDKFFLQKVPVYSFSPFKTGDNPVLSHDENFSKSCTDLYGFSRQLYSEDNTPPNYIMWLSSPAGDKFGRETSWLQNFTAAIRQRRLGKTERSTPIIPIKQQHTL